MHGQQNIKIRENMFNKYLSTFIILHCLDELDKVMEFSRGFVSTPCFNYFTPTLISSTNIRRGPGGSVGIATDYGLDGPGSNPGGDENFRPSRPALGPTQPPLKWVPDLPRR